MILGCDDKIECRTPTQGRSGSTRIPRWKYEAVRAAILQTLDCQKGRPITFKDLRTLAKTHMKDETLSTLGSWGWHFTTVKLHMEVEGELTRVAGVSPQQIVLGQ